MKTYLLCFLHLFYREGFCYFQEAKLFHYIFLQSCAVFSNSVDGSVLCCIIGGQQANNLSLSQQSHGDATVARVAVRSYQTGAHTATPQTPLHDVTRVLSFPLD